jgi:dTDP-4-amino-4,6-dideoxy-D-galactose acyltransferase
MRVQKLDWDSDFFGFPVGRLMEWGGQQSAQSILRLVRDSGCRVVYAASKSLQPGLETHYVLTQVELEMSFAHGPDSASARESGEGREADLHGLTRVVIEKHRGPADAALRELARQAGWSSRFCVDKRFGRSTFKALYAKWIERSCSVEIADVVLTALLGQTRAGLVTGTLRPPMAKIGLIAVDSDSRGLGVGRLLMEQFASLAMEAGCSGLSVVTQAENVPAMRLYSRVGFEEVQRLHWYHVWNDSGEPV